jgi:uncharacterized membrane protein
MFLISSVKNHARARLHANYGKSVCWPVLLFVLISMIITAIALPAAALLFSDVSADPVFAVNAKQPASFDMSLILRNIRTISIISIIFALCNILIYGNAAAGMCYFFLNLYENNDAEGMDVFFGFKHYFRVLAGMLLKNIFTALWFVVLIVPGIIKY